MADAPADACTPLASRTFDLPTTDAHREAMGAAIRFLLAHFREPVRLDEVLALTGMSRATFARLFKRHAGRPFSTFLNELRLQAACHELAAGDRPVLAIALDCGFSQVSFFNRLFRRTWRCSPTEWRRRSRSTAT